MQQKSMSWLTENETFFKFKSGFPIYSFFIFIFYYHVIVLGVHGDIYKSSYNVL
jgi:hypothetical protein